MPPADGPLNVLVLNGSLKHAPDTSNTEEVAELVLDFMKPHGVRGEIVRLADRNIPVGLGFREGPDDDWPSLVGKIKAADVVIFATPIWWGGRSSLMQRVIERLDSLDEEYIAIRRHRAVLAVRVHGELHGTTREADRSRHDCLARGNDEFAA